MNAEELLRRPLIQAAESEWLEREVKRRQLSRGIAMQFVAGETADDGLTAVREVTATGKTATLDYLGESVDEERQARAAAETILTMLRRVGEEGLPCGMSVKPTQMGLSFSEELCFELLSQIVSEAARIDAHITLDMEGSEVTEPTVVMVERLHAAGLHNCGCAVQAYLRRTQRDVERLTAAGASLRLCKGAYSEPPELAYQPREEVDASYASSMDWLLQHGRYSRLATHDHRLIARALHRLDEFGRGAEDFEFQMLYGVRTDLQDELVADGWNVRVYIPFGQEWFPYFMRRLAERPANVLFFLRALVNR